MRYIYISLFFLLFVSLATPDLLISQPTSDWQQRVAYEMDVTLHAERHQMEGRQKLTYYNNSPHTLRKVFYHLYFNAFQPMSMMAERNRNLPDPDGRIAPRIFNLGPDEEGYHRVKSLTQDGQPVSFTITDTVLEVELAHPIPSGSNSVFEMTFESQVPLQTRRSGRDNREGVDYSMSQWYPKIAAYDHRGWHADPYVGREFYAPFGTFDVRLTLPVEYVVGATGLLQNPADVGHGYGSAPTPSNRETLTWHFKAEDVHDFAWVADTEYIHEQFEGSGGVQFNLLYLPEAADNWSQLREKVPQLFDYLNASIGRYPYPQFTVAQAGDGGMEYPMINFIVGNTSPGAVYSVTVHEGVHEWFYGALGNNEADYSWMDEGFTSYTSTKAKAFLQGGPTARANHTGAYLSMLFAQHNGFADRLNTPADWYDVNSAFSIASYSGGQMIAEMLSYVISEPIRDAWLKNYFAQYKIKHPDPYDVERVAEETSGLQLDWFFEQFLNTTWPLDYAVKNLVHAPDSQGEWHTTLTIERKERAVMPVDLALTLEDGSVQWVNIPLSIMHGHKPVPNNWIVAEPWPWTSPTYTLSLYLPQKVKDAIIDPFGLTPDRNRLNNSAKIPKSFTFFEAPPQDWFSYQMGGQPLVQYSSAFGIGIGFQTMGQYLFGQHKSLASIKLWPQVIFSDGEKPDIAGGSISSFGSIRDGSFVDGIDYAFEYSHPLRGLGPQTVFSLSAIKQQGILENQVSLNKPLNKYPTIGGANRPRQDVTLSLSHQYRPHDRAFGVEHFQSLSKRNVLSGEIVFRAWHRNDEISLGLETGSVLDGLGSASRIFFDAQKQHRFGKLIGLASMRMGYGSDALVRHNGFRLGLASIEDGWRNPAYRTVAGILDNPFDAHFAPLQGPGPAAYLIGSDSNGPVQFAGGPPVALGILAGSLTLSTPSVAKKGLLAPLTFHAFSSAGTLWNTDTASDAYDKLIADAGLGASYNVAALPFLRNIASQYATIRALKLVFRAPFWVSHPELVDSNDAFAFRWLFGIQVD